MIDDLWVRIYNTLKNKERYMRTVGHRLVMISSNANYSVKRIKRRALAQSVT